MLAVLPAERPQLGVRQVGIPAFGIADVSQSHELYGRVDAGGFSDLKRSVGKCRTAVKGCCRHGRAAACPPVRQPLLVGQAYLMERIVRRHSARRATAHGGRDRTENP